MTCRVTVTTDRERRLERLDKEMYDDRADRLVAELDAKEVVRLARYMEGAARDQGAPDPGDEG